MMNGLHFVTEQHDLAQAMSGSLNEFLVGLSIGSAMLAAYAALLTVERVRNAERPWARAVWFAVGSVSMGTGIWTMHFIGMLAYDMSMPVRYDLVLTAISILPGIVASAIALHVLRTPSPSWRRLHSGGLLMGAGIGAMHYVGMAAMVMPAVTVYEPRRFILSVAVAYGLATFSLAARFRLEQLPIDMRLPTSAVLMGCAVAGMHYTAMTASFHFTDASRAVPDATLSPIQMGVGVSIGTGVILVLAILSSLIDRRLQQIGLELRESEERNRVLLETVAEGIVGFDADGQISTCNAAAARIFQVAPDTILGSSLYDWLSPDDVIALQAVLLTQGESNSDALNQSREIKGQRGDGRHFPLQLSLSRFEHAGQAAYAAVIRDLSSKRDLENRLLQAEKLESIGQLAAGIAHEINTPAQFVADNLEFLEETLTDLAPVFSQLLHLPSGSLDAAEVETLLAAIESADLTFASKELPSAIAQSRDGITRIAEIVRAMKDFSHPGATGMQTIDLNRAVESTVTVARNEWKYVAEVELELAPDLPAIECHASDINQCVLNILVNGAHAIGARRRERDPLGKICVRTRADEERIEIQIQDDGGGIPESIRDRVFDPFFTTKGVGRGTGQGLAIAYASIVDKHGGSLSFEVEEGLGTTFSIQLPITRPVSSELENGVSA